MSEKLCIFCTKFRWRKEEQWGSGSTMTGPMMTGGYAVCEAGHNNVSWRRLYDETDFRAVIVQAAECPDYDQVKP